VSQTVASAPEWTRRGERGSLPLIRFMLWFSLKLGRAPARALLLRGIAAYFLASSTRARGAARQFLSHALGRPARLADIWRLFFSFASTIHDRVFFLTGRHDLFDVRVEGLECVDASGALLMGAHFGSFEALRACGRHTGQRRIAIAMYGDNARKLAGVLATVAPAVLEDVVPLGHVESMLRLSELLDEGALVGVLADRTLGDEPVLRVPFLGEPAPFPTGPMRLAAALRRRVVFMSGVYRGGNRYDIAFEPLADFTDLEGCTRTERDARVREAVTAYAACLERAARAAPDNWFNFFDFWGRTP
jgi:predicted LPLAT superfamily acyltransferase